MLNAAELTGVDSSTVPPPELDPAQDAIPVLTQAVSLSLKCAMIILSRRCRYIFFLSILILILQAAVVAGQNQKSGVTVSYESLGSSRIARFTNSNSFHVRVEFSYQGTRVHGSSEASGRMRFLYQPIIPPPIVAVAFLLRQFESWALCDRTRRAQARSVKMPGAFLSVRSLAK